MRKKTQSIWVGGFAVRLVDGNPPIWQVALVQDKRFEEKKLPGGMSRSGESVTETLKRELREEFGIWPVDDPKIVCRKTKPDHIKLFCLVLAYYGHIKEDPNEEVVPMWVPLSEAMDNLFREHYDAFLKCCKGMAKIDDCFAKEARRIGLLPDK